MKILVVDDEKFNLAVARDLLEAHVENQGVILCNDPDDVMNILALEDVGIVLLDIIMPKIDGFALLKIIRSEEKYLAILKQDVGSHFDANVVEHFFSQELAVSGMLRRAGDL